ncbi:MAG: AbrB/MazE/SpoVT family DNA-binding domain-containing protein [Candidatus Hydrogenedentota bacterium]
MANIAKITAKGQTTIPREIRAALHVKPGDLVSWEITGEGTVRVQRVLPMDFGYLQAIQGTLSEWESAEDEEAYRDL